MFLSKLPDEQPANRRVAKEIVQKWSRPIFDQYRSDRCPFPCRPIWEHSEEGQFLKSGADVPS